MSTEITDEEIEGILQTAMLCMGEVIGSASTVAKLCEALLDARKRLVAMETVAMRHVLYRRTLDAAVDAELARMEEADAKSR